MKQIILIFFIVLLKLASCLESETLQSQYVILSDNNFTEWIGGNQPAVILFVRGGELNTINKRLMIHFKDAFDWFSGLHNVRLNFGLYQVNTPSVVTNENLKILPKVKLYDGPNQIVYQSPTINVQELIEWLDQTFIKAKVLEVDKDTEFS